MSGAHHHYNPDWLSDDDLLANFVARRDEFNFLRDELARAPREGSAQHYLLVGVRGSGKTTLLKRLAVAIRRDKQLSDHLIALSFPEELYQVKHLADFWWTACDALADELDRQGRTQAADRLLAEVEQAKGAVTDPLSDAGLGLLLRSCAELDRRPVLLVDNLDLVFQRIGKTGRKQKDPQAPAYWALREALSTTRSPLVIGGSVRLSEPFTDYDKAFYDFFIPKRLGKLGLAESRQVLERLADAQDLPEVKQRLKDRPSRIEALHELTGGNPRALGLIFELLRQGPNRRAVEDFERLMDLTTPYYKARFEDLSEQAQVVMHALAVRRTGDAGNTGLRFGHTAAEIGTHAGLPTGTVSAQLDVLEREGLVEKTAAHGRTQYRIAEQLFRLWLQMRANRRIRQNVIGLTEFLEAMFDFEEIRAQIADGGADPASSPMADARYAFAVAGTCDAGSLRCGLEAYGAGRVLQHIEEQGDELDEYLSPGDLPKDLDAFVRMRKALQGVEALNPAEQDALLGALDLRLEEKRASVETLGDPVTAQAEADRLRPLLHGERRRLLRLGLHDSDLKLLHAKRAQGLLPLPWLTPDDAEAACLLGDEDTATCREMVWRLVGAREWVKFPNNAAADAWLAWGREHANAQGAAPPRIMEAVPPAFPHPDLLPEDEGDQGKHLHGNTAGSHEWANVAGAMRRSKRFAPAERVLEQAFALGSVSRSWYERGALIEDMGSDFAEAESAYREAIRFDPLDILPWIGLGALLANKLNRPKDAEAAYRKAIDLDPAYARLWNNLGVLLADKPNRLEDAEAAYHKAIDLDPMLALPWHNLGLLFAQQNRREEADVAYTRGAELDQKLHPWWRKQHADVQTRLHTRAARQALDSKDPPALRTALARLLAESADLPDALVSEPFVEGFLAPLLPTRQAATEVLAVLRELGYAKHAGPLLLAFEAALEQRSEMLTELAPELQAAAQHMFERLATAASQEHAQR